MPDHPETGNPCEHIGDGVYVEWTGFSVDIRVNHHMAPVAVVLEPYVIKALNEFFQRHSNVRT